jgi:hypothetical protein
VAAALLLAGCGGDGGDGGDGGGGGGGGGQTSTSVAGDIDARVGFDLAGIMRRQTKVENLIRECMKKRGFEYTPVDPAAQRADLVGSATLTEEDFEKQFGYGITTLYEQRLREATTSPNATYRESLSEAERSNYDRALYGKNVGTSFAQAADTGEFAELGGCTKEATDEVFGGAEVLSTLQTKLDELDTRIEADARMVAANKEWSACMQEAGYKNLANPDEVDGVLEDKLEEVVGPAIRPGVGTKAPTFDKKELQAVQRYEVEIVQKDIECEEEHIEEVEEKVRKEYEQTFADENAAFLGSVPPA